MSSSPESPGSFSRDGAPDPERFAALVESVIARAKAAGADAAEAVAAESLSLHVTARGGRLEDADRSEAREIALRVFTGKRSASVSSSDLSDDGLTRLAERAVSMARYAPEDEWAGLADPADLAVTAPDLDLFDPVAPDVARLETLALETEAAAGAAPGVTQIDEAWAGWGASGFLLATTTGFCRGWRASSHHFGVSAIAARNGAMERDYDADSARHAEDLKSAAMVGAEAGRRAAARLGAAKAPSGKRTVVFENRVAGSLLSAFASAIAGTAIARGVSFLRDRLGEQVFARGIRVIDDPFLRRGAASHPFDSEGAAGARRDVVSDGVLTGWMLNSASARQLGLRTTGHAARGGAGAPGVSPSNLWIEAGPKSLNQMLSEVGDGVLVTEMFGPSLNPNTGDWSVGVAGFLIDKGERGAPVSEITVAGNLRDMFLRLEPAADLEFRRGTNAPSLRVDAMSVAGL
jgi:PmbA protein